MDGNRCCFDRLELWAAAERSSHCVTARDHLSSPAATSMRPTALPGQRHAAAARQHRAPLAVRVTAVAPVSIWISDAATRSPRTPRVHGPELPVACASSPAQHHARTLRSVHGDRELCAAHSRFQRPHQTNTLHRTRCTRTPINPLSCFATLRPRLSPNATLADRPRCAACVATTRPIGRYALRGNASAAMACDLRDWLRTGPGSPPLPARP
ncbi:hypothetical protein CH72_5631 [Burkholderia ambifaria AMMD]|jgi:hypothetical protein|nr:hypothetical protein CH72_5631 [Burkholderia ambifaria AMMD]